MHLSRISLLDQTYRVHRDVRYGTAFSRHSAAPPSIRENWAAGGTPHQGRPPAFELLNNLFELKVSQRYVWAFATV